jgi:hypothetical protein
MTERQAIKVELVPGISITQFVIQTLLDGLEVKVEIDDKLYAGHVCQLEFARGGEHAFAQVHVRDYGEENDYLELSVAILRDGSVNVLPKIS